MVSWMHKINVIAVDLLQKHTNIARKGEQLQKDCSTFVGHFSECGAIGARLISKDVTASSANRANEKASIFKIFVS